MVRVWHYDGSSAIRHEAELVPEGDGFRLAQPDGAGYHHRWADLVAAGEKDGAQTFGLKDRRGWRIGFHDAVPQEIARLLPKGQRFGPLIDRIGLWPATGAFIAMSVAAIFVAVKTPDWLAPLVPASVEQRLGDAMVGDFGGRVCNGPGGQKALDALVARIEPSAANLKVRIVNIDMVNAVALPGGNVMIFRGLLQQAQSPDELAGVVGHEIGHVRNRDVMQSLLRQMGLTVLLGGANSNVGGSINALVASTYSREAESKADLYSIKAMQRAAVSPIDTAAFFARLAAAEKALGKGQAALGYLSSHPMSAAREKAFRQSATKGKSYAPVINAEQWRAIVDSCKNDPDVVEDDGLLF